MPRLRAKAVEMVRSGKGVREVARYFGYGPGTISKWCSKAPEPGVFEISTESSRPHHHPRETPYQIVREIIYKRIETNGRCAEVIHQMLLNDGISVSLSTVKRILDRSGMTKKRNIRNKRHMNIKRPKTVKQGDLVQIDTIHIMQNEKYRVYVYTLLDVYSRWAYALASNKLSSLKSVLFVRKAISKSPFPFTCLQSDNGPEFSRTFTERIKITHRHSRVRKPNDNAHLERFNRTIQEEFLNKFPVDVKVINKHMPNYLKYYNEERLHLGIDLKTPTQILSKCFQAID